MPFFHPVSERIGKLFVECKISADLIDVSDFNGRWRGGFAIQNLGPKMKYDEEIQMGFYRNGEIFPNYYNDF